MSRSKRLQIVVVLLLSVVGCSSSQRPERTTYPDFFATRNLLSSSHPHLAEQGATDGAVDPVEGTQAFMRLLFSRGRDANLLRDSLFCRKWFSPALRHTIAMGIVQADHRTPGRSPRHDDGHPLDEGSVGTILNCWNRPTSFRAAGRHRSSRSPVHDEDRETVQTTVIDYVCRWDESTQYAGDERLVSLIMVKIRGRWFVDDVYNHSSRFTDASCLSRSLFK